MRNNKIKWSAVALAAVLAFSQCTPLVAFGNEAASTEYVQEDDHEADKEMTVLTIATAEDLTQLAKECTLDSWSEDKMVELAGDIDLTGLDFEPIPVFSGQFDGNRYEISGLYLDSDISSQGLFRYVTENAVVENLTVSGHIYAGESQEYLGGIAGTLKGVIRNCTFKGIIEGSSYVGGIAGLNTETGRLESCVFKGTVNGKSCTGGIVGENRGVIADSENLGRVNPSSDEEINVEALLSSGRSDNVLKRTGEAIENVRTASEVSQDTGGIAGYSTGIIRNCQNRASVGYEHIGYNVGGIAGRSSGYLYGCKNEGSVKGRKDVGGICGQMVPDIKLVFSEDTLDRLDDELDTLKSIADSASSRTSSNRSTVSDRLDVISEYARLASDNTAELAEMTVDWADANIEELNYLADTVEDMVNRIENITATLSDFLSIMEDGMDEIEDLAENANELYGMTSDEVHEIKEITDMLQGYHEQMKSEVQETKTSARKLLKAVTEFDMETCGAEAENIIAHGKAAIQAAVHYKETLVILKEELQNLPDPDGTLRSGFDSLEDAAGDFEDASNELADMGDQIYRMFKNLSRTAEPEFQTFGDEYQNRGDQIHSSVNAIGDQLTLLKEDIGKTGDDISDDMERMEDQLEVIANLLENAVTEVREKDKNDYWQDVSEEDIRNTTIGKAENCVNLGTVLGDINAGGIAGVMDIERALDPEDDIKKEGNESLNFHYETRVILESCVNKAEITAKKNYAGGVCGRMTLGYILDCSNFADVASLDGDYVGGITGQSSSTVQKCYSKCTLSGRNYVGGISGLAYDLYENTAFVKLEEAIMYAGAVAGSVLEDANLSGNLFVDTGSAGVDGICYRGKAEPVGYETLMAEESTPVEFGRFLLKYMADDTVIGAVNAGYGQPVSAYAVPEIPKKSGYHAKWQMNSEDLVMFDRVIEAKYVPFQTTIGSDAMRNAVQAVMLVEGVFEGAEKLSVQEISGADEMGESERWKVSLQNDSGESLEKTSFRYTYRFIASGDAGNEKVTGLVLRPSGGGENVVLDWRQDGNAYVFQTAETEFELLVICKKENLLPAAAIAVILGLGILFIIKSRKSRPQKAKN